MKETDFIKQIDTVGRIVVPKELRDKLMWKTGDPVRFYTDGDRIVLKKAAQSCVFCGTPNGLRQYKGISVCGKCAAGINGSFSGREE